ncbi:MAG: hypothetical protein ACM357_02270 [Gemmatimonadota bacterium]
MRLWLLVVGAGAAFGCARPQSQLVPAGAEFEVPLGVTVRVAGGPAVTFAEVLEDSRCPIDAVCVQAGRATVRLTVDHGGMREEFRLSTREGAVADTVGRHAVRLVAVLPAPRAASPTPRDAYRVMLQVDAPQ